MNASKKREKSRDVRSPDRSLDFRDLEVRVLWFAWNDLRLHASEPDSTELNQNRSQPWDPTETGTVTGSGLELRSLPESNRSPGTSLSSELDWNWNRSGAPIPSRIKAQPERCSCDRCQSVWGFHVCSSDIGRRLIVSLSLGKSFHNDRNLRWVQLSLTFWRPTFCTSGFIKRIPQRLKSKSQKHAGRSSDCWKFACLLQCSFNVLFPCGWRLFADDTWFYFQSFSVSWSRSEPNLAKASFISEVPVGFGLPVKFLKNSFLFIRVSLLLWLLAKKLQFLSNETTLS